MHFSGVEYLGDIFLRQFFKDISSTGEFGSAVELWVITCHVAAMGKEKSRTLAA